MVQAFFGNYLRNNVLEHCVLEFASDPEFNDVLLELLLCVFVQRLLRCIQEPLVLKCLLCTVPGFDVYVHHVREQILCVFGYLVPYFALHIPFTLLHLIHHGLGCFADEGRLTR